MVFPEDFQPLESVGRLINLAGATLQEKRDLAADIVGIFDIEQR
jgi:hypothetical protein